MKCAYCKYNDGAVYTSNPPKYRCSVTGEYHLALDDCNVEFAPVVRCKNCKYWRYDDCQNDSHGYCPINENDYCSQGERKGVEE